MIKVDAAAVLIESVGQHPCRAHQEMAVGIRERER
jgi:hypothetical protein